MAKYSSEAQAALSILSDRPVAYHPRLAKAVGGVKQAIFVCQLLYWHGKGSDPDGWIYKTQEEIEEETGLSRYEQQTVRKTLIKKGVLTEDLRSVPATLHYRLDMGNLYQNIQDAYGPSLGKHPKLDGGDAANLFGETPQSLNKNQESTQKNTHPAPDGAKKGKRQMQADLEDFFSELTGLPKPKRGTDAQRKAGATAWWNPLRELLELYEYDYEQASRLVESSVRHMRNAERPLTVSAPRSIRNVALSIFSRQSEGSYADVTVTQNEDGSINV